MGKHGSCTLRTTAVAGIDSTTVYVNPIRAGHADRVPNALHDMSDAANRCRLAVRSCHRNRGNSGGFSSTEQALDHGATHVAPLALRGIQVHAQPWRSVDLDEGPAGLFERSIDAHGNEIDTSNVETYHPCRFNGTSRNVWVHLVGDVNGTATRTEVRIST